MKTVPDEQAYYEELYRAHAARVKQLCRLLLTDPHDAEEAAQEVFLKLFRQCQIKNQPIAWGPWLTQVTLNTCRDRRRSAWWKWWRDNTEEFQEAEFSGNGLTPEAEMLSREERERIWRLFRALSARQQEVFVLRRIEGWTTKEVAQTLGLTTGSVKRHLFRAVCSLRKAIGGGL